MQGNVDDRLERMQELIIQVSDCLNSDSKIAVLTGSGISSESGIPTFRGKNGIWEQFRPEELANFNAFIKNPLLVQSWYKHRREIIEKVQPNVGHYALAELDDLVSDCWIITQNIDNLHQMSGSHHVVELHGNVFKNYCIECGKRYDGIDLPKSVNSMYQCECGGLIRPDVVWFGELLSETEQRKAEQYCQICQVLISIGTSGVVYPAAGLPFIARENGAFLVEINPEPTELSSLMDIIIRQESGIVLPLIVESIR